MHYRSPTVKFSARLSSRRRAQHSSGILHMLPTDANPPLKLLAAHCRVRASRCPYVLTSLPLPHLPHAPGTTLFSSGVICLLSSCCICPIMALQLVLWL